MCGYCIMARKTRRRTQKEVVADAEIRTQAP